MTMHWSAAQSNWLVAVVNPNCHTRAEGDLARLGYRTFYPKLKKWVSHARVKKAVHRPLLGRYLFVEIPADAGTEFARRCNGIEGFVSVCGVPIVLPEGCVPDLIRRQMSGEWDFVEQGRLPDGKGGVRENLPIPIGARIRVVEGEFNELLATVTNRKHGKLHCKLLGSNNYVHLREYGVRAA